MATNTRQKILDVAYELLLQKGLPATTVDEICEAAAVSKGSFYHFFKTKEEMALALLTGFYESMRQQLLAAPWADEIDPATRLMAFLDHVEENGESLWGEGSLLGGLAMDVAQTHPVIQERVSVIFGSLAQELAPLFAPAAADPGPGAVDLAEHWLSVLEGSVVLARGHQDPSHIARGLAVFRDHIARLLEQSPVASLP